MSGLKAKPPQHGIHNGQQLHVQELSFQAQVNHRAAGPEQYNNIFISVTATEIQTKHPTRNKACTRYGKNILEN